MANGNDEAQRQQHQHQQQQHSQDEHEQQQQQQQQQNDYYSEQEPVLLSSSSTTTPPPSSTAATTTTTTDHDNNTETTSSNASNGLCDNLNDLVADLCKRDYGSRHTNIGGGGLGDYTNIRATTGQTTNNNSRLELQPPDLQASTSNAETSSAVPTPTPTPAPAPAPPTQNSTFSFKRFLNSSGNTVTAPSSTVTSLDQQQPQQQSQQQQQQQQQSSHPTGARPKVPQSASVSSTSISSLMGGLTVGAAGGGNAQDCTAASRMKRSPRFSSFDSQASLAEYACAASTSAAAAAPIESALDAGKVLGGGGGSSGFRLDPDALVGESSDFFAHNENNSNLNYERQFVPRSHSNYDMPTPSPRKRYGAYNATPPVNVSNKDATRPTRLPLHATPQSNATAATTAAKLKLNLPSLNDNNKSSINNSSRTTQSNNDFAPSAAAASALPDFVQDHWLDSWYAHGMHLHSPPNSPICDFVEDLTGTAAAAASTAVGNVFGASAGGAGIAGMRLSPPLDAAPALGGESGGGSGVVEPPSASKMLPDFLSDGPIIHSSQRLADVAAGLPSNSMGSPEEPSMSQLSRMRAENERLQLELVDVRMSLGEQTRRANELERQLQERQLNDAAYSLSMSQNMTLAEERLDKSKRRNAAAQCHVTKLKQQVAQLTSEIEILRRENETLREEGAVGGSCERNFVTASTCASTSAAATSASNTSAGAASASVGARASLGRPSRSQHISRDLLMAAATAENNLRQLLTGVENLRQMAADIEHSELRVDYDLSPELYSDFAEDCDDYEDFSGGPAL